MSIGGQVVLLVTGESCMTEKKAATAKKKTTTHSTKEHATKKKTSKPKAKAKTVQKAASPKKKATANRKPCSVQGCGREYRAKGYCRHHYKEWRHGKFGKVRYKSCKEFECFKPMAQNRHGFCEAHFQSYYVKGVERPHVSHAGNPHAGHAEKSHGEKAPAAEPQVKAS